MNVIKEFYEYIVIGGGSAGCIVAARLASEQSGTVLLLEAGDPATQHPETLSADGFKYAFANDALMSHRMTVPQEHCGGRSLFAGTGRGMGGSGSVNGMVYTRGDRHDFDAWPEGWRWNDVVPAFAAVEARIGIQPRAAAGFAKTFIDAAMRAGFKRKDGMNDGDLAGVMGCNDMNYHGDQRRSSYRAWLHDGAPINLDIATQATALRLIAGTDKVITAVEVRIAGLVRQIGVRGEVVLCSGALETPKLLMLSGIGPGLELRQLGIELIHDTPGVGKNLQDHPNVCVFYRGKRAVDFAYPQVYGFDAAAAPAGSKSAPDTCYVCYAAPASLQQSMQRMLPILALPGRLYQSACLKHFLRKMIDWAFSTQVLQRFVDKVFGVVVILGKPTSRGEISLMSKSPDAPARINPAYFATEKDRQTFLAGLAKVRLIVRQPDLVDAGARPLSCGGKEASAKKIWRWISTATMTTFHFCGSCRMGEDANSPVDAQLRLKGMRNVRIADASVIPEIPVSALNAPSMMIGYRAADFILQGLQK